MKDRILITCALPYANGPLHMGHIRSTYLPGDIYYRYLKQKGEDVAFICATDEHGTPITVTAEKEGKSPKQVADKYHRIIENEFKGMNIDFDIFSRTSNKTNIENAQEFFERANKGGYIYEKEVDQYYCKKCKRFLPDRYVEGECPNCGEEGARGDHCEKCAQVLTTLKNPYCIICKTKPELRKTKHWFFKLTEFKPKLKEFLNKKELPDNVKNYSLTWLDKLQDWCITRDLEWGVPLPVKGVKDKILYVWWDAPIGYISATQEWNKNGLEYWKKGKIVHFIGKDIIYHHALFWPSMLMAHGAYQLPYTIIAGEYLSLEGKKMSTSRDWVVWIDDFLKKYPADYLRYYLTITSPLSVDMDFSWKEFQARINNELSDVLGNFVHRVLIFTKKFYEGKVPKPSKYNEKDKEILDKIGKIASSVGSRLDEFNFMDALKEIMEFAKLGNQYLNEKEPWKHKGDTDSIYISANIVHSLAVLLNPFLPSTAQDIWEQLGLKGKVQEQKWGEASELIKPGLQIGEPKPLVEKIELREEKPEFSGKKVLVDKQIEKELKQGKLSVAIAELTGLNVQKRNGELEKLKEKIIKETDLGEIGKIYDSYRYMLHTIDRGTEGLSSENLANFVKESKMLPNINTLTDIYNLVSYRTGLIMGIYDVKAIAGNVRLKVTDGKEKFVPIGTSKEVQIYPKEYALVDSSDNVITRWLTKENERVKVTEYTKGAILCVQGNKDIPQEDVNKVLEEICMLVTKFCGGKYKKLYP